MAMRIEIVKRKLISTEERKIMYNVFSRYYSNIDFSRFAMDLEAKNWVILLRNEERRIVGFSTLETFKHSMRSKSVVIIYSGDTIIERSYRCNGDLAGAFGHFLLRTIERNKDMPVYWLLTSKGVRTYRFLPVFFRTFFPVFSQATPEKTKLLLDKVAIEKFGSNYSPETQVVSNLENRDWLRSSEEDSLLLGRPDPHIAFFIKKNPGYAKGDELACITEMSEANLNPSALRVIKHTKVHWRE